MASADTNPFVDSIRRDADSPGAAPPNGLPANPATGDGRGDLLNYDAGAEEMFRDVDINMDAPAAISRQDLGLGEARGPARGADGLGIDEEIKVAKKKRVNVKLDEGRLLSQNGIPKLRRISKERLRFKGKGHEFSDISRLLSFYQLWLDDLFPKAKFADALSIIEKLGHSRRLQVMRREWIEESKPKLTTFGDEDQFLTLESDQVPNEATGPAGDAQAPEQNPSDGDNGSSARAKAKRLETPQINAATDDDLYSATPVGRRAKTGDESSPGGRAEAQALDDDDLDGLLAEDLFTRTGGEPSGTRSGNSSEHAGWSTSVIVGDQDIDEDELEAMREMEAMS